MDLDTIFDLPGILPSTALGIYGAILESGTLVRACLLREVRVNSAEEAASRVLYDHDKLNGVRISHYLFYRHRFNEESYDNDLRLRNILLHHDWVNDILHDEIEDFFIAVGSGWNFGE